MRLFVRLAFAGLLVAHALVCTACDPPVCCRLDDDCGAGLTCFDGQCTYACHDATDCADGELCVRAADGASTAGLCVLPGAERAICVERTPPSPADAGAVPRQDAGVPDDGGSLDGGVDASVPCVADGLEPNDNVLLASSLPAPPSLSLCRDDEDWFRLPLASGTHLSVVIAFDAVRADLDLELIDGFGDVVAAAHGSGPSEVVQLVTSVEQTLFARVFSVDGRAAASYDLVIDVVTGVDGGQPPADAGSPDGGVVPPPDAGQRDGGPPDGGVTPVPDGGVAPSPDAGSPDAGRPDAGPPDAGSPDAGPPDAGRPDAGPPDAGSPDAGPPDAGSPDAGQRDAGPPDAGSQDAGPLDAGRPDAGLPDAGVCSDALEPNNTAASAVAAPVTPIDLQICANDEDFIAIQLTAGQTLDVSIAGGPLTGDLDMELRSPAGNVVGQSQSATSRERITFTAQATGRFVLRVFGFGGAVGTYTLTETIITGVPACVDDAFEDNDTRQDATIVQGTHVDAALCADDADLFSFNVPGDADVTFTLGYSPPPQMRLSVSRQGLGVLGTSATGTGLEVVGFHSDTAGVVTVRVQGPGLASGLERAYTLDQVVIGQEGCADDGFEDNDDATEPTLISVPASLVAVSCSGDTDVYRIRPMHPAQTTVTFTADVGTGLLAGFFRDDFTPLGFVNANQGPTTISLGSSSQGVLVFVIGNLDSSYSLQLP